MTSGKSPDWLFRGARSCASWW